MSTAGYRLDLIHPAYGPIGVNQDQLVRAAIKVDAAANCEEKNKLFSALAEFNQLVGDGRRRLLAEIDLLNAEKRQLTRADNFARHIARSYPRQSGINEGVVATILTFVVTISAAGVYRWPLAGLIVFASVLTGLATYYVAHRSHISRWLRQKLLPEAEKRRVDLGVFYGQLASLNTIRCTEIENLYEMSVDLDVFGSLLWKAGRIAPPAEPLDQTRSGPTYSTLQHRYSIPDEMYEFEREGVKEMLAQYERNSEFAKQMAASLPTEGWRRAIVFWLVLEGVYWLAFPQSSLPWYWQFWLPVLNYLASLSADRSLVFQFRLNSWIKRDLLPKARDQGIDVFEFLEHLADRDCSGRRVDRSAQALARYVPEITNALFRMKLGDAARLREPQTELNAPKRSVAEFPPGPMRDIAKHLVDCRYDDQVEWFWESLTEWRNLTDRERIDLSNDVEDWSKKMRKAAASRAVLRKLASSFPSVRFGWFGTAVFLALSSCILWWPELRDHIWGPIVISSSWIVAVVMHERLAAHRLLLWHRKLRTSVNQFDLDFDNLVATSCQETATWFSFLGTVQHTDDEKEYWPKFRYVVIHVPPVDATVQSSSSSS